MKPENWMKWDIDSESDPATRWYLSRFEDELAGYGFFVRIVELLYQSNDHWLTLDQIFVEGFAARYGWRPESVRQAVAWLIEANLFIGQQTDEGLRFSSRRVLREVESRRRRSETNAENGRKGGLKSRTSKRSLPDRLPVAEPPPSQRQAEERRGEEIREDQRSISPLPPLNGKGHEPPRPPAEVTDPIDEELEHHFEAPNGQDWTRRNAYINCGRRPLKKYPRIFLARHELRTVLELAKAKLPPSHWKEVFLGVDARLAQKELEGKHPSDAPAYAWLLDFGIGNALANFSKESRIARTER